MREESIDDRMQVLLNNIRLYRESPEAVSMLLDCMRDLEMGRPAPKPKQIQVSWDDWWTERYE